MKSYDLVFLPSAWEDLKRIDAYYCIQFDKKTAKKVTDYILKTIERLTAFPDSGVLTPDDWLNKKGFRMIICKKHIAIYKCIDQKVYIYHIADTKTRYTKLFY